MTFHNVLGLICIAIGTLLLTHTGNSIDIFITEQVGWTQVFQKTGIAFVAYGIGTVRISQFAQNNERSDGGHEIE